MYYTRFINITNPLKDVEKMYNNGEVKKGDIVFQKSSSNYCKCFFNGAWLRSIYNSKIKVGNEIEDDINILSTSIVDISNSLTDISTRLYTDYLNKDQYLKDEQLIASAFADLNNKINNIDVTQQLIHVNNNIDNLKTKTNNIETTLNNLIGTDKDDINNTIDTFKEVEKFLNNISDSSTLTELLITTKNDINGNITETLKNYYTKDIIDNVSINTSTRLNDVSVKLNDTSTRLNDTINKNQENITNITNIINSSFIDIYNKYLTIDQYLKDETLIASTFNELNNKINSLQEELNELKNKTN